MLYSEGADGKSDDIPEFSQIKQQIQAKWSTVEQKYQE